MHQGYIGAVLRGLAFLTRLPAVASAFDKHQHRLGDDAAGFPVVGLIAAAPAAPLLILLDALGASPLVSASFAVASLVLITGALHEDGLGDVADGLCGHADKARALAIMKDSRIGSYGALALILSVLLRVGLIADLLETGANGAALALLSASAASRGAMAWLWSSLPSADPGGLADRMGQPPSKQGLEAAVIGAGAVSLAALILASPMALILPLLLGLLVLGQFRRFLLHRLGGQTGDTLGAAQQITEIAALLGFALALG